MTVRNGVRPIWDEDIVFSRIERLGRRKPRWGVASL
nr:MAG TPA: hypothetical protein [Caudoviricetes sp.]